MRDEMMSQREKDLRLALDVALKLLAAQEPGDSRAVSSEFVAMAAVSADLTTEDTIRVLEAAKAA